MAVPVLLMTPVRSFGELIQQALQETGLYRVVLVNDAEHVVDVVRENDYHVAVLDLDLDAAPEELIGALHDLDSGLRIIAIKDETDSTSSPLEGLRLAQHLNTPFYLPDLLDALDVVTADMHPVLDRSVSNGIPRAFASSFLDSKKAPGRPESPEWLDDASLAAIHLTRLSLESSAQAALITRNAQLWAYAGHLPHPAAEELAEFVGRYWDREGGSDFARFIRLDAVTGEYILYATGLGGEYVLALAFDTEIAFTKMRSQAKKLAGKLVDAPQVSSTREARTETEQLVPVADLISKEEAATIVEDENLDNVGEDPIEFPKDWRPDQGIADSRQAFFDDLLSTVEVPEPDVTEKVVINDEKPVDNRANHNSETKSVETIDVEEDDKVDFTRPVVHPSIVERNERAKRDQITPTPNYLLETLPTPVPDYLRDTLPTPTRDVVGKYPEGENETKDSQVRKPAYLPLTYACVLVPKLSRHHLVGELAIFLNRCVVQVGKAFGWQFEHLSIRPNYLHWVIAIPPGTSPGYMVRIMRDHASHRIFNQFPGLAQENQTGDFWAAGYLIVNGKYPLSHQLVEDFIGKIRVRQALPHHHSLTDI